MDKIELEQLGCLGEEERLVSRCVRPDEQDRFLFQGRLACSTCMQALSETDPVTGLPNERALLREFEKLREAERLFGALSFDLENFKQVNEMLTHPVGNLVLRSTAKFLDRAQKRKDDRLTARTGGDEFVMLARLDNSENDRRVSELPPEERLAAIGMRYVREYAKEAPVAAYNQIAPEDKQLGLRFTSAVFDKYSMYGLVDLLITADPKGNDEDKVATNPALIERMRTLFSATLEA